MPYWRASTYICGQTPDTCNSTGTEPFKTRGFTVTQVLRWSRKEINTSNKQNRNN